MTVWLERLTVWLDCSAETTACSSRSHSCNCFCASRRVLQVLVRRRLLPFAS